MTRAGAARRTRLHCNSRAAATAAAAAVKRQTKRATLIANAFKLIYRRLCEMCGCVCVYVYRRMDNGFFRPAPFASTLLLSPFRG